MRGDERSLRWTLNPDYGATRRDPREILAEARRDRGAEVKSSRVRAVYRLPATPDRPGLVVKVYHARGLDPVKSLFLGAPAEREWKALLALRAAGVRVPVPVAFGRMRGLSPRRSVLITEAVEGAATLEAILLGEARAPRNRRDLARAAGVLIRNMHRAGVIHRDLHAANLLADPEGRLWLLDLHGARLGRVPSFERALADLIAFAGAFMVHGTRTDRLRFFRAYADDPRFRDRARRVEEAARTRLAEFLLRFDRRCLRPGHLFRGVMAPDLSGVAERTDRAPELARRLDPYSETLLERTGRLLHAGISTRVYAVTWDGNPYIVKAYLNPGLTREVKRLVEGSKARRAWLGYHRLRFRGLPTPRPVLYLEEPFPGPAGRSYLVTEGGDEWITLDRRLEGADTALRRKALANLAFLLARMHRLFLRNRDLKAQNILVNFEGDIRFIDPDGVGSMRDPSTYLIARDLMRLNASFPPGGAVPLTDRLRFLDRYLLHARFSDIDRAALWRETYFLTWRKWDRWYEAERKAERRDARKRLRNR